MVENPDGLILARTKKLAGLKLLDIGRGRWGNHAARPSYERRSSSCPIIPCRQPLWSALRCCTMTVLLHPSAARR
jgi:hypothetical protein